MSEEPNGSERDFLQKPLLLTEGNLLRLRETMHSDLISIGGQILGDSDQAEDVLMDVTTYLLRMIKKKGPWQVVYPRGWFYKIYRRRAYRYKESGRSEVSLSSGQEGETEIELPDDQAALRMERKILAEELMRMMPEHLKWLVEMRAFQYRWNEIAEKILDDPALSDMFRGRESEPAVSGEKRPLQVKKLEARLRKLYQRELTVLAARSGWR